MNDRLRQIFNNTAPGYNTVAVLNKYFESYSDCDNFLLGALAAKGFLCDVQELLNDISHAESLIATSGVGAMAFDMEKAKYPDSNYSLLLTRRSKEFLSRMAAVQKNQHPLPLTSTNHTSLAESDFANMRTLSLRDNITIQGLFRSPAGLSPLEYANVEDYRNMLLGEAGSVMNLLGKEHRTLSRSKLQKGYMDESADMFAYLLMLGMKLKMPLQSMEPIWEEGFNPLASLEHLFDEIHLLTKSIQEEKSFKMDFFSNAFRKIKGISETITGTPWQEIINEYNKKLFQKFTDLTQFTPDGLYRGNFYIQVEELLSFLEDAGVTMPEPWVEGMREMAELQHKFYIPTLTTPDADKSVLSSKDRVREMTI